MDPVGALRGLAVVDDVGDEVVGGVLVRRLHLLRQVLSQVHVSSDGEHKATRSDKGYRGQGHGLTSTVYRATEPYLRSPDLGRLAEPWEPRVVEIHTICHKHESN